MCRPCCEYQLIRCLCPFKGTRVGYTVPCCRNAVDQCDPCIIHPGCSLFENCKTCHNGTWKANDNFFVNGKYCTECRQGWSGGDCKTCGGVLQRPQGHVALEGYPTNARCEWTVQVARGSTVELGFTLLSLEADHSCRYDYVEVRDGEDLNSPVIGRFCGDELPPQLISSGNHLHILFISDGYNNFDGFVLTYQESPAEHLLRGRGIKNPLCPPPEKPVNGDLLPTYGPKKELQFVNYRCHPPFTLVGSQQRTCLSNGTWSGSVPMCLKGQTRTVLCPSPLKLLNGYQRPALEAAGGAETIEFFCKKSYILIGNHQSTCLSNGSWSSSPPKCVKACREPKVSELVQQSVVNSPLLSRYNMRDLLSAGFLPLPLDRQSNEGERLPRGFHRVHTSIEYKCASPLYGHTGSSRRTCLRTGRWSGRHVSCSPVCGKIHTFSTYNLSDTLWPWHAAVYIRSPPDYATSTERPHRKATSDHQGTSEESTFWYLACSGALLTQHSVLVTAECVVDKVKQQPLLPAHVKVVIGTQYQTSKGPLKSLHHLRVSDILIHPTFFTAPESNVALLKLKDKAKISQHVLPVCLPKRQGEEVTVQQAYASRWILTNNHGHLSRPSPMGRTEVVELRDVVQCEREFARGGANGTVTGDSALCVFSKPSSPRSSCPGVVPGLTTVPAVVSPTADVLSGHRETQGASNTNWQLLGLEGFDYEGKICHKRTHTVQVRVANFKEWIEKNMK